jgi:hypothetical protein
MIDIPDEADLGARMLNAALADERGVDAPSTTDEPAPTPAAATPAAPAIAAATPDAPETSTEGDPAPVPVDGGLGDQRNWEQLEDGSVKLANGHVYASADAALDALWHAQQHIAQTRRAPEPPPAPVFGEHELEDEEDSPRQMLLRPGQPIGGEPQSVQELAEWALEEPGEAAMWALANQDTLKPEYVRDLYAHWRTQDPAAADNYNAQIQLQAAKAEIERVRQETLDLVNPVLEEHRQAQVQHWTQQLNSLPLIEHYGPRIMEFAQQQGQQYIDYLATLSPQEEYEELRDVYSRLRVDDSIAAASGDQQAQQIVAAQAQAQQQQVANGGRPVPVPPPGVPVTEGRGRRGPEPVPAGDPIEMVRAGIAAYQGSNDMFGSVPT